MAIGVGIPEHLKKKPVEKADPNKRRGWRTPYGFIDFSKPVTYEEACEAMKEPYERFMQANKVRRNDKRNL